MSDEAEQEKRWNDFIEKARQEGRVMRGDASGPWEHNFYGEKWLILNGPSLNLAICLPFLLVLLKLSYTSSAPAASLGQSGLTTMKSQSPFLQATGRTMIYQDRIYWSATSTFTTGSNANPLNRQQGVSNPASLDSLQRCSQPACPIVQIARESNCGPRCLSAILASPH
jgi:hypothetical protein